MVVPSPGFDDTRTAPPRGHGRGTHGDQTEARAALALGAEEGLERALLGGRVHADARVDHSQHRPRKRRLVGAHRGVVHAYDLHRDPSALRHRVAGVRHQVHQNLLHVDTLHLHVDWLHDQVERDVVPDDLRQEARAPRDLEAQVETLAHPTKTAERQQLPGHTRATVDRVTDVREHLRSSALRNPWVARRRHARLNDVEHVVEVVRDASREAPQRFEALRRLKSLRHAVRLGDVLHDALPARVLFEPPALQREPASASADLDLDLGPLRPELLQLFDQERPRRGGRNLRERCPVREAEEAHQDGAGILKLTASGRAKDADRRVFHEPAITFFARAKPSAPSLDVHEHEAHRRQLLEQRGQGEANRGRPRIGRKKG
ncbi:MAG: hypothetical protein R3B99_05995 [Polyangiales bacterium]